jgi:hypothetical protein
MRDDLGLRLTNILFHDRYNLRKYVLLCALYCSIVYFGILLYIN